VKNIANNDGVSVTFGDRLFNILQYYNEIIEYKRAVGRKRLNVTKAELSTRIPYDVAVCDFNLFLL